MTKWSLFGTAVLVLTMQICPAAAENVDAAAVTAFDEAVGLFADGKYKEAGDGFRKAYRLKPSWKILYNIGQADTAGKRYGLALDAFERYLVEGGDEVTVERQNEVRKEIERLRGMVGYVKITAPTGAEISIDGVVRGTAPLNMELPVTASVELTIIARVDNRVTAEQHAKVIGGRTLVVDLKSGTEGADAGSQSGNRPDETAATGPSDSPAMPAQTNRKKSAPLKMWGWASVGLGGAALIAGGITGGIALSKNSELKKKCESSGCYGTEYDSLDTRDALAVSSTVLLAAGGAIAVTGLVLLIVGHKGEAASPPVSLMPSPGGVVIEGRF